mgnify:CR=1 FL=1
MLVRWQNFQRRVPEKPKKSSTFLFWNSIIKYTTLILTFVRAECQRKFLLYVEIVEELQHFFFALDHINHARWAQEHIRNMNCLHREGDLDDFFLSHRCRPFYCLFLVLYLPGTKPELLESSRKTQRQQ